MENQKEQPNERKAESGRNVHLQTEHTAHAKDKLKHRSDDAGYTEQENQFADGKGTQLTKRWIRSTTKPKRQMRLKNRFS